MIRLSIKALANYMISNSSKQRKILREYKYKDESVLLKKIYYQDARELIKSYHRQNIQDASWLLEQAETLRSLSKKSIGMVKTRYANNSRALIEYANIFGKKKFEVKKDLKLSINFDSILIVVAPDLHVIEKGVEKLIKLEFVKKILDHKYTKIISQFMLEAAISHGMSFKSSNILFYDVHNGYIIKGARMGARISTEIKDACKNIEAIWEAL